MSASPSKHGKIRIFHAIILAFLPACFSLCANAQNPDVNIAAILKQLGLKEESVYTPLVVRKTLPYAKNHSVIIIPKIVKEYPDCDVCFDLDAYILIAEKGKIVSRFYEPNAGSSDAWQLQEIVIDTAPYILNGDTRAFGVRVHYQGSSRVNPASETVISLFVPRGGALKRVLGNYPIVSSHGEWDGVCEGEFFSSDGLISVGKEKTNDFANLIVKKKHTWRINQIAGDECGENEATMNTAKTLKFDGQEYR
ncbi:MAG: hypothetical protein LBQ81_09110 [Zoogloeaceae bacterium]|jgi:hypothetical protein|nr:hypothetical protein [Zoogloeaceae bacterium]